MKYGQRLCATLGTLLFVALCALTPTLSTAQVNIWTHHANNSRSGGYPTETTLTTSNVNGSQFGKLFAYSVDASVFAQPLIISNLTIPGKGTRNVVFLATMNNSVYAFDADTPVTDNFTPLWQVNFNNAAAGVTPVPGLDISSDRNYDGQFGIMGTPVIDQTAGTMYLVARTKENGAYFQRLHALDITTGKERANSPVAIAGTITNADGSSVTFNPKYENQRPALALANGMVYIAWASMEDLAPYQGWVIGYNTGSLTSPPVLFSDELKGSMGGIWMAGQGPSVDASGNLYLSTGNGSWDGVYNFSQSVLKLSPTLSLTSWFTPDDHASTSGNDLDIGSSGVLLIPGTSLVLAGSKAGKLYLMHTSSLGGIVTGNGQIPEVFQATSGLHIHGGPTYWNGPTGPLIYVWGEQDYLKAFSFNGSTLNATPVSESTVTAPPGMPGGFLAVSSNGSSAGTGILWASMPLSQDAEIQMVPGILRAFDATNLTTMIWNSETNCTDQVGSFAKYVPPVVANGKVYLPNFSNQLLVYGNTTSTVPASIGSVACNTNTVNLATVGTADWAKWPNYIHKATGGSQISNLKVLGTAGLQTYNNDPRTLSYSGGTPTATGSDTNGNYLNGRLNGFQFTAPADTTTRTLYVYAGGYASSGTLTAHLSDGSSPDYVDSLAGGSGDYDAVYAITYKAASAAQTLTVSWIQTSDTGNVDMQGAALAGAPPVTVTGGAFNVSSMSGNGAANLTSVGTSDWAKWPNYIHKSTGNSQVSDYSVITGGAAATYTNDPRTVSYTDGTPTVSGSDQSAVYVAGVGNGFRITAPASATSRTITIYAGGYNSGGSLVAHLSDGSAADFVSTTYSSNNGAYDATYAITYNAASANQTLTVTWTMASGGGNVTLQAVALSGGTTTTTGSAPLAPTNVAASDGTSTSGVTVTWTASANATSYTVYRSNTSGQPGTSIGTTTSATYTDTTVVPGTTYYYSVVATNTNGPSPASTQNSGYAALTTTSAGVLTATATAGNAAANLTTAGTSDWAKWPNYVHKATGASQISTYTIVGGGALQTYNNDPRTLSYSDGTPTAAGSDQAGVYVTGNGTGFQITAPASTTKRTLTVYVGGWNSGGTLVAHLSDGSAADYSNTSIAGAASYDAAYTLTYSAASASQKITVTWTQSSGDGNVTLQGATLSGSPTATGGTLAASSAASNAAVNLTSAGGTDWVKWPTDIHKSSGGSQISTYTVVGGAAQNYANDPRTLTYSDGTPTTAGSDQAGVYVAGVGNGFQITAPASTTSHTLTVYLGGWNSGGSFTASLSDGSATAYSSTVYAGGGQYDAVYTITYSAASAGQTINVSWTQASGGGNVTLQGATLN